MNVCPTLHRKTNRGKRRIQRPVFVVGCNNSGTTILWEALAAHPELQSLGLEGQLLEGLPARFGKPLPCAWRLWSSTIMRVNGATMLDLHARSASDFRQVDAAQLDATYARALGHGKRLVEKSPPNTIRTRYLQAVYPDATFIAIVRAPVPVAEGICRTNERLGGYGIGSLYLAANHWKCANERLLEDAPHLRRFLLISYGDLVRNTRETLSRVFEIADLDPRAVSEPPAFAADRDHLQAARLTERQKSVIASATRSLAERLGVDTAISAGDPRPALRLYGKVAASIVARRIVFETRGERHRSETMPAT